MPSTPKLTQSSPRKLGAPKAKGAARAKSGCYTCRIRRKKCDEEKSDRGSCKTCDRLRLECLGYGNKRPDWLREAQTVVHIRDRIKGFLASQGMIKGHSGPASRDIEQEPSFLTLRPTEQVPRPEYYSSPESETSTLRSRYLRSLSPDYHPSLLVDSYNSCALQPAATSSSYHDELPFLQPRLATDMAYNEPYSIDEQLQEPSGQAQYVWRTLYCQPATLCPIQDPVTEYYIGYVFEVQYLLANRPAIKQMILHSIQTHRASWEVVQILNKLHSKRRRLPHQTDDIPTILQYLKRTGAGSIDDAMAVLHSVSAYLFNGGDGAWDECIDFAASHVEMLLSTTLFRASNPLQYCNEKTAFVVKTAIWFDVLASITTGKSPRLRRVIDGLFNPSRAHLQDLGVPLADQCSMLSPMGCENDVVWAISEISSLADWKQQQQEKGLLSVLELVGRADLISQSLCNPVCNQPCRDDGGKTSQYSASNIFRAAAHLYLATVVSGDFPLVPDVSKQALKVYEAIHMIQEGLQSVVRSTVFAFFLCGCFLTDAKHQEYIKDMLLFQEQSTEIGNSGSIVNLLDSIWKESTYYSRAIPWRSILKEKHILLV